MSSVIQAFHTLSSNNLYIVNTDQSNNLQLSDAGLRMIVLDNLQRNLSTSSPQLLMVQMNISFRFQIEIIIYLNL
jgi:hypothetical protein